MNKGGKKGPLKTVDVALFSPHEQTAVIKMSSGDNPNRQLAIRLLPSKPFICDH